LFVAAGWRLLAAGIGMTYRPCRWWSGGCCHRSWWCRWIA